MSTRAITSADYTRVVHTIRVTIHTTGKFFESDTRSGNHASVYLLTADGSSSIRLNMTKAGPTDKIGTYQISQLCLLYEITRGRTLAEESVLYSKRPMSMQS